MELFIHLAGFFGGWLLVAGPIYQAAIELREETVERGQLEAAAAKVPQPKHVSNWWWLLPPVHYLISRSRSNAYRQAVFVVMPQEQRAQMVGFVNKATGWMFVAGGAFLIALKETWELVEILHWPTWVFWVGIVVMSFLAVGNTIMRLQRAQQMVDDPEAKNRR